MARLSTFGFEAQTTQYHGDDPLGGFQGATLTTTNPRSGLAAASCAADTQVVIIDGLSGALDRFTYVRCYMRFSQVSLTNPVKLISPWDGTGGHAFGVWMETNGTITLRNQLNVQVGSASAALSANTYYMIEHEWMVPTGGGATAGTLGLRVEGVEIARSTATNAGSTVKTEVDIGRNSGTATLTVLLDDIAVNDSTAAAAQTGYPGPGNIVLLKPISDGTRTGFTGGAGGTTNLFDANNNFPPTGVISPGTNASQNGDATSNTTDNYNLNLAAYSTAVGSGGGGMVGSDVVRVIQALARGGNSTTTSTTFGIQSISNPVIAEATQTTGATAAGTEPTGWTTKRTPVTYNPAITPGTSPQVRFRKGTASANRINCDMMGMVVEYQPNIPADLILAPSQGAQRHAA